MSINVFQNTKNLSIFQDATSDLKNCLRAKNLNLEPFFLLPTKYISDEAAILGEALSKINNQFLQENSIFRTFFCNSHLEAINGTVKIMRHNGYMKSINSQGLILIFDPLEKIKPFYDSTKTCDSLSLTPGIVFISKYEDIEKYIMGQQKYIGFIFLGDETTDLNSVDHIFALCRQFHLLTGYSFGLYQNWYTSRRTHIFTNPPDVFLYGENLTQWQVPFGCFSMEKTVYKPWDNINTCLIHSSTFSGNTLSLKFVQSLLRQYKIYSFPNISLQDNERFTKYATYVNPKVSLLYRTLGLAPKSQKAQGVTIYFEKKGKPHEVIDLVAGSGSALRGHNPSDLDTKVLQNHSNDIDYWKELENKIGEISSFTKSFPAVSGSSAVDIAIRLAMLCSEGKTRIIAFTENYSGKSLIALNLTSVKEYRVPFKPLYFDAVEIDPFTSEGKESLKKELESGKIALVWFEIIQGESLNTIPTDVLELLENYRKQYSFLIGVDEILSGMFRTGSFLAHQQFNLSPDIVTIGKGMSDMTFPTSATLVTEELYQKAIKQDSSLVNILKYYYLNQLSAHITLNALTWCIENNITQHVKKCGQLFQKLLQDSIKKSKLFQELRGRGLFFYLTLNKSVFPINLFGEYTVEFALSSKCLNIFNIHIMNSRITPPLTINEDEIIEICKRLNNLISVEGPISLFFFCLKNGLKLFFSNIFSNIFEFFKKYK